MACARCGCGVYQTEDLISLNKIWHKCCFTCRKSLNMCPYNIDISACIELLNNLIHSMLTKI